MNIGRLVLVENTGSGRGSARYNQLTFVNESGTLEQVLLTDRELNSARDRAVKNSGDLEKVGWLDRCAAWELHNWTKLLLWIF